jgi:AcrR family transcriptional regulator
MARRPSSPDLARSIYLLWGHHPQPGRTGLRAATIVEAGISIADTDGLDALSMRRVADHLGVGAMSLYGHVPGKADLVALMVDTVCGEMYDDVDEARRIGDWRAALSLVAHRNWELYRRHPWMLDLPPGRPNLGPHTSRKYETEIRPLDGIGLTDLEMDGALTLLLSHVDSVARTYRNRSLGAEDGMTDEQWWAVVAPVLDQVMVDEDLAVAGRVGTAVGEEFNAASADPETALAFGLETILDGIQARIDRP